MGNSELEEVSAELLDFLGKKNRRTEEQKAFYFSSRYSSRAFVTFYVMIRLMYLCYMLFVYAHILLENTQEKPFHLLLSK